MSFGLHLREQPPATEPSTPPSSEAGVESEVPQHIEYDEAPDEAQPSISWLARIRGWLRRDREDDADDATGEPEVEVVEAGDDITEPAAESEPVPVAPPEPRAVIRPSRPEYMFESAARLKNYPVAMLAQIIGVPTAVLQQFFAGRRVGLQEPQIRGLANLLGIDLGKASFTGATVHVLRLDEAIAATGDADVQARWAAIGILMAKSKAVRLDLVGRPSKEKVRDRRRFFAVISDRCKVLVIAPPQMSAINLDAIPDGRWARHSEALAAVPVRDPDLCAKVASGELTPTEIDEAVLGDAALSWNDIQLAARINQVSREDLIEFIERQGAARLIENRGREEGGERPPELTVVKGRVVATVDAPPAATVLHINAR